MRNLILALLLLLMVALLASAVAMLAQPSALGVAWWTVDGGGATSSGGNYQVGGTVGQTDAAAPRSAGPYQVAVGYWNNSVANSDRALYLPVVRRP